MNDFVTLVRQRIKAADDSFIVNAVQYPYNPDVLSDEWRALRKQYYFLQETDENDNTLSYHAVFILDKNGVLLKGEAWDYRVPEPTPEPEEEPEA